MDKSKEDTKSVAQDRVLIDTSEPSPIISGYVQKLDSVIVGQHRAIRMMAQGLEIDEASLNKPGALALKCFCAGPPGVGKTESAYALSRVWIGELLRGMYGEILDPVTNIDCTQYVDEHNVANLTGSTKGYVGYEDSTPLSQHRIDDYALEVLFREHSDLYIQEKVQRGPKTTKDPPRLTAAETRKVWTLVRAMAPFKKVILFDEVDRAHPNVWNLLITIMNGKPFRFGDETTASFERAALLMSSNINEKEIQQLMGGGIGFKGDWAEADPEKLQEMIFKQTLEKIKKTFPPAFVSRIRKNIVVFRALHGDDWAKIVDLRLSEIAARFEKEFRVRLPEIKLVFTDECKRLILEKGIDRMYGARPLEQTMDKHLLLPMARAVNWHKSAPDKLLIAAGDTLVFEREKKPKDRIIVYRER